MLKFIAGGAVVMAATFAMAAVAAAAAQSPSATELIFDHAHLSNTKAGDEIVYNFERKVSDEKLGGAGFKDEIKLKIEEADKEGKKNIALKIFTGERGREEQKITELTINPVFVVGMQQAIASFRLMAGGDLSYLKRRFGLNVRDKSKIVTVKFDYKGQTVDGYKIDVAPFESDPNMAKMKGYDVSEFTFIVSVGVPGEIAEMVSTTRSSSKDSVSLIERTTLAGYGGMK
jgi:hypothetical protein